MAQTRSHTLLVPVTLTFKSAGGAERTETITALSFPTGARLKAKDLRCTDGHDGEVAKTLALIAHLTGQPIRVVDELDSVDFEVLAGWVGELRGGLATGGTS